MNPRHPIATHFTGWIQRCGVVFIAAGLALAFIAATWKAASRWISTSSGAALPGYALLYLLLAGTGIVLLRWIYRRWGSRRFLLTVLGASFLIQLGVLWAADSGWEWTGDSHIFQHYLTRLSEHGYTQETLEDLSQNYDYRVWTRRAQPFYYLLRTGAGEHFVLAVQLFQALLLTLSLLLTHRLARLFFGKNAACWAVTLQFLMPFRWFACLDLNHHILGGFYFLLGLWLLAEWTRPTRTRLQTGGLILCAGLLFPLMHLEGGIDLVYWGATGLVLLLYWLTGQQTLNQTLRSSAVLLVWPVLASTILLSPLFERIDRADLYHHESGAVGFMARGWVPETGGEYSYTPEQIDFLTPHEQKVPMQTALLLSQAAYNPRVLFTQLLPIKMAKYSLLGYAAGAEEMLARNGAFRAEQFAEGARTAFLLMLLPLALWGIFLLLPLLRGTKRLCLILPCCLLSGTFVLLGETSPRYSIYIQPFLFLMAALPLSWCQTRQKRMRRSAWIPLLISGGSLAIIWGTAALLLFAARPWLRSHAVEDMRLWQVPPETEARPLPPTQRPFEIQLLPQTSPQGTDWGRLVPPDNRSSSDPLVLYALPAGATSRQLKGAQLITTYNAPDGPRHQTNSLPGRIRLEYSLLSDGTLHFQSLETLPVPLRIGYATYESEQKTSH